MGVLSELGRFAGNLVGVIIYGIGALIAAAIWAVGTVIDLFTDILSWINGKLESLLNSGAQSVNCVQGEALANFIKESQAAGTTKEISLDELNTLSKSVINVAVDKNNNIVEDQMIRGYGLAQNTQEQFQNQHVLKIKIPA